ncbi:hypothetical protein [Tenacibaculum finnmarkense]|uniref:Uncharacterized protein n=1 Tax=Tenacibaculum finnmarkense genomovar ulcerans TaxID=2781388 RepID=A0A2I2MC45_9FLAO|nr:hypothetical protein [Tenacibaculum finnmarkense]MBE7698640.1 hypothetical protein [Tenacibaculum finnmarkense genomovar ulcerans]SOU89610.1 hypothetical protein TNO010_490001 [Tenacibaculum finnmarkense genomovar ulcerans]
MEGNKLAESFYKFLEEEKGFPKTSLLKQTPAYNINARRVEIDLLLLDIRIGNYIGQVEFKTQINPQTKNFVKVQTDLYAKALKSEGIPTYLVFPIDEGDFQILVYGEKDWISISKDEFPEFETLSTKKKIEEKIESKQIEEKNLENIEKKREYTKRTSLWTLTSLIIGVLTSIFAFYISTSNRQKVNEPTLVNAMILMQIDSLETQIHELKKTNNKTVVIDTLFVVDSTRTYAGINRRLKILENGILDNAEKTLALKNTNQKIELLKQSLINQEKQVELRNDNLSNRIELLNAIVIGMVLSLFAAAIGFVISNYNERKNTNANNGYN